MDSTSSQRMYAVDDFFLQGGCSVSGTSADSLCKSELKKETTSK